MNHQNGNKADASINESEMDDFELDEEALGKLEELDLDESIDDFVDQNDI